MADLIRVGAVTTVHVEHLTVLSGPDTDGNVAVDKGSGASLLIPQAWLVVETTPIAVNDVLGSDSDEPADMTIITDADQHAWQRLGSVWRCAFDGTEMVWADLTPSSPFVVVFTPAVRA